MRTLATNTIWVFAGDVIARLLGFIALIHLTSVLGPSGFGVIAIGLSVLTYLLMLVDMGMNTMGTREAAKQGPLRAFPLIRIVVLELSLAALLFVLIHLILPQFQMESSVQKIIQLYAWYLFSYALFIDWYHQGIGNYSSVTRAKFIAGIVYVVGVYCFVSNSQELERVPIIYLVGNLAAGASLIFGFPKGDFHSGPPVQSSLNYLSIFRRSVPIGLGGFLAQGVQALPPLVVGLFYPVTDVGILRAALSIAIFLMMADRVFIALFLPAVSRMAIDRKRDLEELLNIIFKVLVVLGFSLSLSITLLSHSILLVAFGTAYQKGSADSGHSRLVSGGNPAE